MRCPYDGDPHHRSHVPQRSLEQPGAVHPGDREHANAKSTGADAHCEDIWLPQRGEVPKLRLFGVVVHVVIVFECQADLLLGLSKRTGERSGVCDVCQRDVPGWANRATVGDVCACRGR